MASHFMVAVKDRAINAMLKPFFAPAEAAAIRAFKDEVTRPESEMHKHPEDYDLYMLGVWYDHNGQLQQEQEGPRLLCRGQDCI